MRSGCRAVLLAGALLAPAVCAQPVPPRAQGGLVGGRRPGPPAGLRPRAAAAREMILHLMSLPPSEQRVFLASNPRFRSLPPRQQENIRRRLEDYNSLPPGRREALRERFELFGQLTPAQQDRARELYQEWNRFPPRRRLQLRQGFRDLRQAAPEERRRMLDSEEFRGRYSESERRVLQGLADLLPERDDR